MHGVGVGAGASWNNTNRWRKRWGRGRGGGWGWCEQNCYNGKGRGIENKSGGGVAWGKKRIRHECGTLAGF